MFQKISNFFKEVDFQANYDAQIKIYELEKTLELTEEMLGRAIFENAQLRVEIDRLHWELDQERENNEKANSNQTN